LCFASAAVNLRSTVLFIPPTASLCEKTKADGRQRLTGRSRVLKSRYQQAQNMVKVKVVLLLGLLNVV
jgi:hypothetical protein